MRKFTFTYLVFIMIIQVVKAQDIQFTQFYTNVLYANPAFAGSHHQSRIILHERVQWPGLEAKYITSLVSYDTYLPKYSSGLGFYLIHDQQGNQVINSNEFQSQYSFDFYSKDNKVAFRLGAQMGLINRTLDYATLIFPDQVTQDGYLVGNSSINSKQNKTFIDISFGGLAFTEKTWFGYSAHHLNRPNQSFISEESILPIKHTFILGHKIKTKTTKLESEHSFTPTIHYKFQGKSDQMDVGSFYTHNNYMYGIWYRGLPLLKHYGNNSNNESLCFLFGHKFKNIVNVSYSYDFILSELTNADPWGAHELNITIFPKNITKSKPILKKLPCPDF